MYRIRFHGRGGQGMKTASRILGTAFFLEGFEVQDAPRYGAERRGAPLFAYVRAARQAINERGIIREPDLVVVADDSLVPVPAAGVLTGLSERTVLLINSWETAATWQARLNLAGPIVILPIMAAAAEERSAVPYIGAICAGAAARLLGVISRSAVERAIQAELTALGTAVLKENMAKALQAYDCLASDPTRAAPGEEPSAERYAAPDWAELPFEAARIAAPAIFAAATSEQVKTGLWRTLRPIIDYSRCNRCWWVCSSFCPDGAIRVTAQSRPEIDYDHCKGCMVCVVQCPPHAIETIPEHEVEKAQGAAS